jgi:PqqD family protein of HPr-rel-A system
MGLPVSGSGAKLANSLCWRRQAPAVCGSPGYKLTPVYDPISGETHFLNELPSLLLEVIDERPRRVDELVALLNDGEPLDADAKKNIEFALTYLEQAELAESAPCQA